MMRVIRRRFRIAVVVALLAGGIPLAALERVPTAIPAQERGSDKPPSKGDSIVVTGCLAGPTLDAIETAKSDDTGRVLTPITFQLRGDKELLKKLRGEHDGKQVEVKGVLKSNLPNDSARRGATVGKTKITFGVGTPSTDRGMANQAPALPVLDVKSYDGTGARCAR
jgi:hypothetical protein